MSHAQRIDDVIRSLPTVSSLCTADHDPEVFRSVLERIGDKWSILLIGVVVDTPHRFTELLNIVPGISRRMLTVTLRALERDGLVRRTVYAEVPPRVEYEATELGTSLGALVHQIALWAAEYQEEIMGNRTQFDSAAQFVEK